MNATNLKFGGQKPKHLNKVSETNKKNTNSIEVTDRAPIQKRNGRRKGWTAQYVIPGQKLKALQVQLFLNSISKNSHTVLDICTHWRRMEIRMKFYLKETEK